jgi:hypothetical protein
VRGDTLRCAAERLVGRLNEEVIAPEPCKHAIGRAAVHDGSRTAFENLGRVPCKSSGKAAHHRHCRENGGIARPTRDDHIGALLQRADVRLGAHHADDAGTALDRALVERRCRLQRLHPTFAETLLQVLLFLLRVHHRELESEAFLARDLLDDLAEPLDVRITTRGSGRADEERHVCTSRSHQHDAEIALYGFARKGCLTGAEMAGARVCRSGVATDEVRRPAKCFLERRFEKSRSTYARGRKHADFVGAGHVVSIA